MFDFFTALDTRLQSGIITGAFTVIAVIIGSMIIPQSIAYRKEKISRNSLMRMIFEDVSERKNQLDRSLASISVAIERAKLDKNYHPVVVHSSGEDYLDLKVEKWLIPTEYAQRVIKFYSNSKGLVDLVGFTKEDVYKSLSRERQINVLLALEDRMKQGSKQGQALASLIEANGWLKK
ncbi:hypothetical protein AAEI00_20440 [Shewanella algae]|uniref:hypothetical protein n=1 Tax=Shewanella algae TaxID=38313 RepID=UPI00313D9726